MPHFTTPHKSNHRTIHSRMTHVGSTATISMGVVDGSVAHIAVLDD